MLICRICVKKFLGGKYNLKPKAENHIKLSLVAFSRELACISFDGIRSTGDAVVLLCQKFLGLTDLDFYCMESHKILYEVLN